MFIDVFVVKKLPIRISNDSSKGSLKSSENFQKILIFLTFLNFLGSLQSSTVLNHLSALFLIFADRQAKLDSGTQRFIRKGYWNVS